MERALKIYGDTQEERDRVLAFIGNMRPEVDLEKWYAKAPIDHGPDLEDRVQLKPENIVRAMQFIAHFLKHKP